MLGRKEKTHGPDSAAWIGKELCWDGIGGLVGVVVNRQMQPDTKATVPPTPWKGWEARVGCKGISNQILNTGMISNETPT